ncbi:MAG TPA: BTAD domain-containing putative transcriptional regulator [Longimicrobiales bacterium]
MIRLTTLGRLDLQRPDGSSIQAILQQPKRLALLVYLAFAGPGGFRSRDTVLAMFWPESDEDRARGALNQALHVLRRWLGRDVIVNRGPDEIGIAGGALWCDAVAFQAALAAGDDAGALALYAGALLEGFHVAGAPGFERWLEEERGRLRRLAAAAGWRLAEREEAAGNALAAVERARTAVALSGNDEVLVRRLIELLDRVGDRAGALEVFEAFAQELAEEYEAEPSAETQRSIASIRARTSPLMPAAPLAEGASRVQAAPVREPRLPVGGDPAGGGGLVQDGLTDRELVWREPRPVVRSGWVAAAWRLLPLRLALIVGAMALAFGWLVSRRQTASVPGASDAPVIAIARLTDLSEDASLAHIAAGVTAAVVSHLDAVDGLKVITAEELDRFRSRNETMAGAASRLNVVAVARGSVLRSGNRLRINIELTDAQSGETISTAVVERPYGELFALIDELSQEIVSVVRVLIGREVRLRLWQAGSDNVYAWELLQHAEADRERARAVQRSGAWSAAATYLKKADSLLALAEAAAPDWIDPLIQRGEVASDAAWHFYIRPPRDPARVDSALRAGVAHAERALARDARSAAALELRGKLAYWTWLLVPMEPDVGFDLLRRAEADLRAAIEIAPRRARAWSLLSASLFARGEFADAHWAAARAYEADVFLDGVDEILGRLFATSFEIGDIDAARRWCAEMGRRLPDGWAAAYCQLRLLAWAPGTDPHGPEKAWQLVARGAPDSEAGNAMRPRLEMLAAAVLARAGLRDSAEAVVRRAAARREADPELLHLEAGTRLLLGQRDSAVSLLARYAEIDPLGAPNILLSRRFASLRDDPRLSSKIAAARGR